MKIWEYYKDWESGKVIYEADKDQAPRLMELLDKMKKKYHLEKIENNGWSFTLKGQSPKEADRIARKMYRHKVGIIQEIRMF